MLLHFIIPHIAEALSHSTLHLFGVHLHPLVRLLFLVSKVNAKHNAFVFIATVALYGLIYFMDLTHPCTGGATS